MAIAPISMKQADSIAAYRIVRVSAGDTVALCTATTDIILGVTTDNANAANQRVPVAIGGIARVYCNDSIAAGGWVMTDASGRGVPASVNTAGIYVVGVLLGPKVNATGAIAEILVKPQQLSIP